MSQIAGNMSEQAQIFVAEKSKTNVIQRTSKYELLRFLAAFFVLAFHCLGNKYTWTWSVLNIFLVIPVPLFLILSGFFLANSKKAKILKYLWMLLIFYLINIFISFFFFKYNLIHENVRYRISWEWVLKFGWGPWWYFWTIPILYLFAPFLNFGLKSVNKWYSLTFIIVLYVIWFCTMNISYYPQALVAGGQIVFFIVIYMLGAWWRLYGYQPTIKNAAFKIALSLLLAIEVINIIMYSTLNVTLFTMGLKWQIGGWDSVANTPATFANKDTTQPFAIICALAIFVIFQNIKLNYNRLFNFLGKLSIPIFLFHFAFIDIVNDSIAPKIFSNIDGEARAILVTLLVTAMTTVFSLVIIVPVEFFVNKGVFLTNFVISKVNAFFNKSKILVDNKNIENQLKSDLQN